MDTALSLVELTAYIVAILALSMSVTWAVVRISPSESAKNSARRRTTRSGKGEAETTTSPATPRRDADADAEAARPRIPR